MTKKLTAVLLAFCAATGVGAALSAGGDDARAVTTATGTLGWPDSVVLGLASGTGD